jgi:WD40 repeat protein
MMKSVLMACALIAAAWSTSTSARTQSNEGTPPERVWTLAAPGGAENWVGEFVSLGAWGTQVFCHRSNYVTGGMLLSRHDGDPPTPVWDVPTHPDDPEAADSAVETDVHASLARLPTGEPNSYQVFVRLFRSHGLEWTYSYPHATGGRYGLDVSRDGQTIVAAIHNPVDWSNDVLIFGPASPEPVHAWTLPAGTIWSMDLAEGGQRLVLGSHQTIHVLDVTTGEVLWTLTQGPVLSSYGLALNHDGTLLVRLNPANQLEFRRWTGSTYALEFAQVLPPGGIVSQIAISRDDSTCAYGISFPWPSTVVYSECLDLASQSLTMSERVESWGEYQNTCLDVAISDDGGVFAVAQAGDAPGLVDEVRVFSRYSEAPLYTLDLPGSAWNVDVSPDGRWVVAGSKGVHINQMGAGGQIDLIHLDTNALELAGTPSVGGAGTLTLHGEPGQQAWLLYSTALADPPPVFPWAGMLFIDPAALRAFPFGTIGLDGSLSAGLAWPPEPELVGVTLHVQGLLTPPKALTPDWLPITLLP